LLVNVFADSSFSRRYEYVFRTKEAHRLATAIEYFIEKFMSVMHIRMETMEGAFDDVHTDSHAIETSAGSGGTGGRSNAAGGKLGSGLHNLAVDDPDQHGNNQYGGDEIDLLGLEVESSPISKSASQHPSGAYSPKSGGGGRPSSSATANSGGGNAVADLFDSDPFGEGGGHSAHTSTTSVPFGGSNSAASDLLGMMDDHHRTPPPPPATAPAAVNLFSDDPFGSGDPFGAGFSSSNTSSVPSAGSKIAPPLTPQQVEQHKQYFLSALANNGGMVYDDGTLQIHCKVEVRGSQCRLSLQYVNESPASLNDMKAEIIDSIGLLRFEAQDLPPSMPGLGKDTQVIMVECMKPAFPGPQLKISYVDSFQGKRNNTIQIPLLVTSFNEPLTLKSEDFMTRWQQLTANGQESQQVVRPSHPIVLQQIYSSLTNVSLNFLCSCSIFSFFFCSLYSLYCFFLVIGYEILSS
jgi:hypothetical protein